MKSTGKIPTGKRSRGKASSAGPGDSQIFREKYRASEKRFKDLLFHLPVGVYRTTPAGKIVAANPALIRMLGYNKEAELRNVNVKDLCVQARDRAVHLKKLEKRQTHFSEFKLRRKDGKTIWGRDYPRAIKGKDGKIVFCDGILVDIGAEINSGKRLKAKR